MANSFAVALGDLALGVLLFLIAWFSPAQVYKSWEVTNFVFYGLSIVGIRHLSRSLLGEPLRAYLSKKGRDTNE